MQTTHDCLIIGMQPSGLIAAALLAKRGYRVGIVDHGESTASYSEHAWKFPLAPGFIPNLKHSDCVRRIHRELESPSLFQSNNNQTRFQAILPKHRLDIPPSPSHFVSEIRKELPEKADIAQSFFEQLENMQAEISAFLNHFPPLPPYSFRERFRQKHWWRSFEHLHESFWDSSLFQIIAPHKILAALILSPLSFLGYLPKEDLTLLQAARLLYHAYQGIVDCKDAFDEPALNLLQMAKDGGAIVHRDTTLIEFKLKRNRIINCETTRGETIQSDWLIHNSTHSLAPLLVNPKWVRRYEADRVAVQPSGTLMTVNILVDRDVIPEGMADTLLLVNGRIEPRDGEPEDPPIVLRRLDAIHQAWRKDGTPHWQSSGEHQLLSAACAVSLTKLNDPEQLETLKEQLLKRLERIVPFLNRFMELTSIPASSEQDKESSALGRTWNVHPIFADHPNLHLGLTPKGIQTCFKNLYQGGREMIPGLGLEGEYISALGIADEVTKQLEKRKN